MRTSILFLLLLSLAANVSAQEFPSLACPDGTTITPQMTITLPPQPPATRDALPETYFVSVLTEESIPTLATTDENGLLTCAVQDGLAEMVSLTYGIGTENESTIGLSPYSAWIAADTATENTMAIGELSEGVTIVIEGGRMTRDDNGGDIYTFTMEPGLVEFVPAATGMNEIFYFDVSILSTDGTYIPGFSFLDEAGEPANYRYGPESCTPEQCGLAFMGITTSYTGLRVPSYTGQQRDGLGKGDDFTYTSEQDSRTVRLRVEDTNTEGAYTLIVRFHVKTPEPETITAQAIDNGDGSWMVRCDGELAFENGIKLTLDTTTLTSEAPLTLTALGDDSPITMAVFTSPTEGTCVPIAEAVSSYSATLPNLSVAPTLNGAQVTLDTPPAFVLIGSTQPSALTLLVEGWETPLRETLVAEENPDLATILQPLLTIDVTPGIVNTGSVVAVYAIASDDLADPAVGVINDAGQPVTDASGQLVTCNDAGIPDECALESLSLTGYSVTLAEGRVLPGASLDAAVILSLTNLMTQVDPAQPRLHIAAADRTGAGGPMVLVIAFALGQ